MAAMGGNLLGGRGVRSVVGGKSWDNEKGEAWQREGKPMLAACGWREAGRRKKGDQGVHEMGEVARA